MTVKTIGQGGADYTGVVDTQIDATNPTVNYSGTDPRVTNFTGAQSRGLMRFDGLSSITGPVTVSSATLRLATTSNFAAVDVAIYKLLVSFNVTQATFNQRVTGTNWATAGAYNATDTDLTLISSVTAPAASYTQFTIPTSPNFVALVEGWINGTITNNGILIACNPDSGGSDIVEFVGSYAADAVYSPLLTVTYTAGTASDPAASTSRFTSSRHTFGIRR